jgi:hypothetical protein
VPPASDQRTLATALAAQDDAALAHVFAVHGVNPTVGWRDFFDAAEGMLDPAAVTRTLHAVPADAARALARAVADAAPVAGADRAGVVALGLAAPDGRVYPSVAAAVAERPVPDDEEPVPAPPPTAAEEAAAAEVVFARVAGLADILLHTLETPLTRIGNGSLGAADRRALVEENAADDGDIADLLVDLAETTRLLAADDRRWLVTDAGRDWIALGTAERWARVARRLRAALPSGVRTPEGGWIPAGQWPGAHPFDPAWPARAARWRGLAEACGLVTPAGAEPAWALPMARGGEPDTAALAALLPPEVDRVYLQNDLTAIAPGPLAPALELRLRRMAVRESRAQASSYRFTGDSISEAITAGESAASMREFLGALSLTGIPQPLEYVIERTAARHGLVRVGRDARTGRTRVTSEDPALLEALAVDQALRALGLVNDGDALASRVGEDAVFWGLADARYPVVAVDDTGARRTVERARIAAEPPTDADDGRYAELLARLRGAGEDDDAAWLERELDQAVRARAVVDVVVRLPDGATRTFRLEATGLGGGRLRGRDRAADVERTLPLSSIASVHPV